MRPLQSLRLRQAIVTRLRADADLTAIVPEDRIYGRRSPATLTWPFVRCGAMDETPLRKGTELRVSIHGFSKQQYEDEAADINAAVQASLEDAVIELSPSVKAYMVWIGAQIIEDAAEASAWHGIATFNAVIG